MYLLHEIRASEVEHGKKLEQYEFLIGFFLRMAPGNFWIQNLEKCQNLAHTKNDAGSMNNFFFPQKIYVFFPQKKSFVFFFFSI